MKNILAELRGVKNLSQEDLGKLLKVSRQTVISIEKGRYNPSLELAFRISFLFGRPIEEIFMFEGSDNNE